MPIDIVEDMKARKSALIGGIGGVDIVADLGKRAPSVVKATPESEGHWQGWIKPTLKEVGQGIAATPEVIGGVTVGALNWIPSKVSGLAHLPFGREAAQRAEETVAGAPGKIPFIGKYLGAPKSEIAKQSMDLLGKGIDVVTYPARKAGEFVTEKGFPRVGYITQFAGELLSFKLAHMGGRKIPESIRLANSKKMAKLKTEERQAVREITQQRLDALKAEPERLAELVKSEKSIGEEVARQNKFIKSWVDENLIPKTEAKALPQGQGFELKGKPFVPPPPNMPPNVPALPPGQGFTLKGGPVDIVEAMKPEAKRVRADRRFVRLNTGKPAEGGIGAVRGGILEGRRSAPAVFDEPKPFGRLKVPGKQKESIRLKDRIKELGGIRIIGDRGEFKEMPQNVKMLTKKDGIPIDKMQNALIDDGYLNEGESLRDLLRMNPKDTLNRLRPDIDVGTLKGNHLTVKEREVRKSMEPPVDEIPKELENVPFEIVDRYMKGDLTLDQAKAEGAKAADVMDFFDRKARKSGDVLKDIGTAMGEQGSVGKVKVTPEQKAARARLKQDAEKLKVEGAEAIKGLSKAATLIGSKSKIDEVRGRIKEAGADNFISEKNGVIKLSEIRVEKKNRGQGIGSKAMKILTDYADETGQKIVLTPSTDFGATSVGRLKKFYRGSLANYDNQSTREWLRGQAPPPDGKLTLYRATPEGKEIKPGDLDDIYPADGPGEFWYAPKSLDKPRKTTLFPESNRLSRIDRKGGSWQAIQRENPGVKDWDGEITIYRTTVGDAIRPNDFVAINRNVATSHLKNFKGRGEAGKIVEMRVKAKDLLMANDATEFIYSPPKPAPQPGKAGSSFISKTLSDESGKIDLKPLTDKVKNATRDVKDAISDIGLAADKLLGPISTRLGNIHPSLKANIRKFEHTRLTKIVEATERILPFLNKVKGMSRDDKAAFDLARKNGDAKTLQIMIRKYNMGKEYSAARKLLDQFHNEAVSVGYDVNYTQHYHPRVLKDPKGFLKHFYRSKDWPVMKQAIKERAEKIGRALTEDEKAQLINNMLRGFKSGQISLSAPGQLKARTVPTVTPELNKFYMDSDGALLRYIAHVTDAIEGRRFFGKKAKGEKIELGDMSDTIGGYVSRLLDQNLIKPEQEPIIRDILNARFNERGTHGMVGLYKNLSYIDTMGSPISAITQIGDLCWALYQNPREAARATGKAILNRSEIKKADIGIDRIAEEFADTSKMARAVDKVFKTVGIDKVDMIGKEALINSTLAKERRLSQTEAGRKVLRARLEPIFEKETGALIKDLQEGRVTQNVKLHLFNTLSDFEPISLSEMPEVYLKTGNGRLFYMLKTFTIKQFDIYRRETFQLIAKPETRVQGIKNLVWLTSTFAAANASADLIKAVILNRPIKGDDIFWDNVLRLVGMSKFVTWKIREEGLGTGATRMFLPPVKAIDAATKDIVRAGDGKGMEITASIPYAGKFYYWWFGKGAGKSERRRKEAGKLKGLKGLEGNLKGL